jgi:hypothetical protein
MGGSTVSDIADTAAGAGKSGLQMGTGGLYDPNTGTIKTGKEQLQNIGSAASGGTIMKEVMPEPPKLPAAPNPAEQQKRAEAEAKRKIEDDVGAKGRGLSSTILGGSKSQDTGILRKKKLLGE